MDQEKAKAMYELLTRRVRNVEYEINQNRSRVETLSTELQVLLNRKRDAFLAMCGVSRYDQILIGGVAWTIVDGTETGGITVELKVSGETHSRIINPKDIPQRRDAYLNWAHQ